MSFRLSFLALAASLRTFCSREARSVSLLLEQKVVQERQTAVMLQWWRSKRWTNPGRIAHAPTSCFPPMTKVRPLGALFSLSLVSGFRTTIRTRSMRVRPPMPMLMTPPTLFPCLLFLRHLS